MFNLKTIQRSLTIMLIGTGIAAAAPGELAQQPLSITTNVPPNILFYNDDSDSMDWEILTTDHDQMGTFNGTQPDGTSPAGSGDVEHRDDNNDGTADCEFGGGSTGQYKYIVTFSPSGSNCDVADDESWRARNSDFNKLYFDPTKDYGYWSGVNKDNEAYTNMDIENALDDPYYPGGGKINLTTQNSKGETDNIGFRFYTWSDDGDGIFDDSDNPEDISDDVIKEYRIRNIKDKDAATWGKTAVELKQNFANWFSYHRKRGYAAKFALGSVISQAENVRIGYATINNSQHQKIDNVSTVEGQKDALLEAVYKTSTSPKTPLLGSLDKAGRYYTEEKYPWVSADEDQSPLIKGAEVCQLHNTILMTDGYYTDSFAIVDSDGDGASNTLADIADRYSKTDPSMSTYTVGFGVEGSLGLSSVNDITASTEWPDPNAPDALDAYKIDDLIHAAFNGHGEYFSASDSEALTSVLLDAFGHITGKSYSSNAVALSSYRNTEDSKVFFSLFDASDWSGELLAYGINSDGSLGEKLWSTSDTLTAASRNILSYDGVKGAAFNSDLAVDGVLSADQIDYLGGGQTKEGAGGFRVRNHLLGDIVNASPVYLGAPSMFYPDRDPFGVTDDRYSKFWNDNHDRTPVVYVGANDGMLHGFNANSGEEVLAYVPETLFPTLGELTDPDYAHRYYVDRTPAIADAYLDGWKTLLVGGLGAGGRGLYALDITDPDSFNTDSVLWEFNSDNDADLGYTLAKPVIGLSESGDWVAFVGNGYNSDSGVAALFIIKLDATPTEAGWNESDYIKISTKTGDADNKNGLSSVTAVDSDGNGKIDRVYGGDLEGNLWAFKYDGGWKTAYGTEETPVPLLKTTDATGTAQPITVKPAVIRHPDHPFATETSPNLMLYFGTGQYLTTGDLTTTQTQTFYAVWDDGTGNLGRDDLTPQNITLSGTDDDLNVEARITDDTISIDYNGAGEAKRYGWLFDLPESGERVIAPAAVINGTVFFTTYTPSTETCGSGGSGWFMTLRADNGGPPINPIFNLTEGDFVLNNADKVKIDGAEASTPSGLRTEGLKAGGAEGGFMTSDGAVILNTDQGPKSLEKPDTDGASRGNRLSWKEIRFE